MNELNKMARPVQVYDMEPHHRNDIDMVRHNRFYQAKIDSRYMESGERDFEKLPDLFVITITDYDLFGEDYMMYTVENRCLEVPDMAYEDGLQFLYFYTNGAKGGNCEIKSMLNYFSTSTLENVVNEATREIHEYINKIKVSAETEVAYMKYDDLIWKSKRRGRNELIVDLQKVGVSLEQIADAAKISVETVQKIIEENQQEQ